MAAHPSSKQKCEIQQLTDLDHNNNGGEGGRGISKGQLSAPEQGPCGFRELISGVQCGCQSFWKKHASETSQCACGHHACFHQKASTGEEPAEESSTLKLSSDVNAVLLQHLTQLGRLLSNIGQPGENLDATTTLLPHALTPGVIETIPDTGQFLPIAASHMAQIEQGTPSDSLKQSTQSRASTSYLPRLPSACNLPGDTTAMPGDALQTTKPTGQELLPLGQSAGLGLWLNDVAAANRANSDHPAFSGQNIAPSESTDEMTKAYRMFNVPHDENDSNIPSTREPSGGDAALGVNATNQLLPALDVNNFASLQGIEDFLQSATELATPSIGTRTPDLNIPAAVIRPTIETSQRVTVHRASPQQMPPPFAPRSSNGTPALSSMRPLMTPTSQILSPPFLARDAQNIREISSHLHALRKFMTNQNSHLRGLGDRLDAVERRSTFSQIPRENEVLEKLEMIETRIIEVEGKVDDARANGALSFHRSDAMTAVPRRHNQLRENASVTSNLSFQSTNSATSSALALARDPNALKSRIDGIDERVMDLEKSLPPSFNRPIEVEVILIPWGRELRGLWVTPGDKIHLRGNSRLTTQDSEEWTQSRGMRFSSRVSASLRSAGESGWSSEAIHDWAENADEWLVPRACGIKSVVYHRLKSRGFVKTVELNKPGAREMQDAITKSCGETLAMLNVQAVPFEYDEGSKNDVGKSLLGLDAAFIPLRKVHRSSRLHFLSKPEMLTPALWTSDFLLSSVVMHASGGLKRLFVTHREAYIQRAGPDIPSWSWQKIRELPRMGPDSGHVDEGDAREACWAEHPILDALPLSLSTSFASHNSSTSRQTHNQAVHNEPAEGQVVAHDEEMAEVKSESNSGFESEAVIAATKPFIPITPVTETANFSTQQAYDMVHGKPNAEEQWDDLPSEDEPDQAATPHPANLQTPYFGLSSNPPRYNLRRHTRTLSNPLADTRVITSSSRSGRGSQAERRVGSGSFKRITRSFSTPSNPLIATLPSFVPSSPNARPRPRRVGTADSSTGNKRRRVDRSISAEGYLSYNKPLRSRSTSLAAYAPVSGSNKRGKRAVTPVGPYMTPYSGNFGSGYLGGNASVRSAAVGEADSEWEGVVDDEVELQAAHDTMQLNTEDFAMDDEYDEDEEDDDGDGSNLTDQVGYA